MEHQNVYFAAEATLGSVRGAKVRGIAPLHLELLAGLCFTPLSVLSKAGVYTASGYKYYNKSRSSSEEPTQSTLLN